MRAFRSLLGFTLILTTLAGCGTTTLSGALRKTSLALQTRADEPWQSYPNMPSAREHAANVTIGFQMFVVGGRGGELNTQVFRALEVWSSMPALPTPRNCLSAVEVPANQVLAIGGKVGDRVVDAAELMNTVTGKWRAVAPMPTARANAGADADGVFAYVVGGCAAEKPLSTVERFDIRDGKWTTLPSLATAREGCVAVRLGRRLVVFGGKTANGVTGSVERYNLDEGGAWQQGAPMPTPRACAGVAVYGQYAFLIGGLADGGVESAAIESYDVASDSWTQRAPLPIPLVKAYASKLGNRMIVTGGTSGGKTNTKTWGRPFPFGT